MRDVAGRVIVERRRASHHDASQPRAFARAPPHDLSELGFRLGGHRAAVEHRDVRVRGAGHDRVAVRLDHRPNRFAVVVVRAAPEGAQVDLHTGTAPAIVTRTSRCAGLAGNEK